MKKLGIFAKTFPGTASEVFKSVKAAGLDTIQFNFSVAGLPSMPDEVDEKAKKTIQDALAETPLHIEAVSGTFNMAHPDAAVRERGLRQFREIARQCDWLDTKLITLCTGSRNAANMWEHHSGNNAPDAWYDMRQTLDTALEIADEFDLYLGVEPEMTNVVNTIDKAVRLLREVNSPRLKIVFDPANLFEVETPEEISRRIAYGLDQLGEYMISAHAKDRLPNGDFAAAGKGVLPYHEYLAGLKRINYEGNLIMHGLKAEEVKESVRFIKKELEKIN